MNDVIEKKKFEDVDESLPLGQKLLDAGFTLITLKQIGERFGVLTYNKKFQEMKIEEMTKRGYTISEYQNTRFSKPIRPDIHKHKNRIDLCMTIFTVVYTITFLVLGFVITPKLCLGLFGLIVIGVIYSIIESTFLTIKHKSVTYTTCEIRKQPISSYVKEKIPTRCIKNIKLAKQLGIEDDGMYVCYPQIKNGTEEDYDPTDPIIIAELDENVYIEIDYWE
jgi:hypothetical protein